VRKLDTQNAAAAAPFFCVSCDYSLLQAPLLTYASYQVRHIALHGQPTLYILWLFERLQRALCVLHKKRTARSFCARNELSVHCRVRVLFM
jgi:hypothetical protein